MEFIAKFFVEEELQPTHVMESIASIEKISKSDLSFTINNSGKRVRVNPLDFLIKQMKIDDSYKKEIPLITNAVQNEMISLSGEFQTYKATKMWYIVLVLRKKATKNELIELFSTISLTAHSFWAKFSLGKVEERLFDLTQPDYEPTSKLNLPKLPFKISDNNPYIPENLGWLNYWPAPALKRIGFKQQHRALFHSVQDAANGGLILQITKEPLDFEMEGHLRKTVAIYDALPAIGGRDCV